MNRKSSSYNMQRRDAFQWSKVPAQVARRVEAEWLDPTAASTTELDWTGSVHYILYLIPKGVLHKDNVWMCVRMKCECMFIKWMRC